METKFKKLSLALLTLGISGVAAAGGYVPPAKETGYHVGIELHYLHQHNDSDVLRFARTVGTTEHTIHVADFDWNWGFNLEGAYHDGDGNDYKLEWTWLDDSKETTKVKDSNTVGPIPHLYTFYNTIAYAEIHGITQSEFNQVNLEVGHTFDDHHGFVMRVHGGLAWAEVDKDLFVHAFDTNGATQFKSEDHSQFSGVGIRTGVDMDWAFYNELHIVARAAVALLYGDIEARHFTDDNLSKMAWTHKLKTDGDEETIVPELQARFGLAWHHNDWVFNAGWRHDVLVHADKFVFIQNPSPTIYRDGFTGNYSHGGPFLGVVWHG